MMEEKWTGPVFSVPMFFKGDGSIDTFSLERYLNDCCDSAGISVLYSMAYNTRFAQMTPDEIEFINKLVCNYAKKSGKLAVVGHPLNMAQDQLDLFCERMKDIGADAVSVLYPERYYGIDDTILEFLQAPVRAGLGLMFHEMKLVSGFNGELVDWPLNLISKAMDIEGCIAVKEDSKNDSLSEQIMRLGIEKNINVVLAGGGKRRAQKFLDQKLLFCWLNGSLMLCPRIAGPVSDIFIRGDKEAIADYLEKIEIPFFDNFVSKVGWHVGHKFALHLAGYCDLAERKPMPVISSSDQAKFQPIVKSVISNINSFQ